MLYEMTDDQLNRLLRACEPVPYIVVGGMEPITRKARANAAWSQLGSEMGFDSTTVKPFGDDMKDIKKFTATPTAATAAER